MITEHIEELCRRYKSCVEYIEYLTKQQLIQALGKEIVHEDFVEYMSYHYRHYYQRRYQPQPWSFAIRRSAIHSAEGMIRIERQKSTRWGAGTNTTTAAAAYYPVETFSRCITHSESLPMSFMIGAATQISFTGQTYLHTCLLTSDGMDPTITPNQSVCDDEYNGDEQQQQQQENNNQLRLVANARAFASYIVILGRITSDHTMEVSHGFLLQNKEEIMIPLILETIPTAKEFRKAVKSLSPTQQRFASAYRSMQLESTLFGMALIQLKPQYEKLLDLPRESLSKEI
jgi:hypothetical protein